MQGKCGLYGGSVRIGCQGLVCIRAKSHNHQLVQLLKLRLKEMYLSCLIVNWTAVTVMLCCQFKEMRG